MPTQIGAFFPTRDMPADASQIRDWAQAGEALGYDYLEISDHVLGADRASLPDFEGPYDVDDSFHETFCTLSYIAAVTEKVGLASGVLILPQRQTALVAKQAAQVDVLSNGRLRLGIGVGWNPVEYEALGEDWSKRGRRQAEQVTLMNQLWTQRTVDFEGDFDMVKHAGVNPLPIQRPIPVWFGGGADPVLRRAAKLGQGWIPLGNPGSKTSAMLDALRGYLKEEGRDPATFGIEAWIRYGDGNPDDWRATADKWLALGATHLTFYTSGQGAGPLDKQIAAMRAFKETVG
ncbi:MAG: LLM class F420-dependent oxidoreductase [Alphaproteobacteria bacterium]|jgi:probable F420-dependent oxidoreductase|nr:LLM class F420-dependent oxidoreductase [Alphaproteobacteria bacterium]